MSNRKILYGYLIRDGKLTICEQEAEIVRFVYTQYLEGYSYQKIAENLNAGNIPYCRENPLWNKHKIKRMLENPRFSGSDDYPAIIDGDTFQAVQAMIRGKTENQIKRETRETVIVRDLLHCGCGGNLERLRGTKKLLHFKCFNCGRHIRVSDDELTQGITEQLTARSSHERAGYEPSEEAFRLANAINRALEQPESPENVVALIRQGISARYACCDEPRIKETRVDLKHLHETVESIVVEEDHQITLVFR